MASKGILFLCISLAVILMITSDAAARDLADTKSTSLETTNEVKNTEGVETTMHEEDGDRGYPDGGHGGYPGGGHGGYPGGGHGGYPGGDHGGYPGGGHGGHGGHGGGGYCRHGCCGHSRYGRCRCCSYAGEAVEAEP